MSGTRLQFTTAYHPQTDGQSEVTNRGLEQYLRAFTFDQPKRWAMLLPWAELALNCNFHASIGTSPFRALYGRDPPNLFETRAMPADNPSVEAILEERSAALQKLKECLSHAQIVMADAANRHRRNVEYSVGNSVWLKLQPYRQHSVGKPVAPKLARRFYGPFKITERIGKVAYRLQLPAASRIHDVFHVSLLRPFVPPLTDTLQQSWPSAFVRNQPVDTPIRATAARTVLVQGTPQEQWQVYWSSSPTTDPSWEPMDVLQLHFPTLRLEDKPILEEGGVDRTSPSIKDTTMIQPEQEARNDEQPETEAEDGTEAEKDVQSIVDESSTTSRAVTSGRPRRKTTRPARYKDYKC